MEKLDGRSLNNKYSLILLDAISFFTNIPLDLAVRNVSGGLLFHVLAVYQRTNSLKLCG